jgi:urea carboxylase
MTLNSEYAGHKLLVANRGEIAVRIILTAQRLGIETLAIYTSSDALSPHVTIADEAAHLQSRINDQEQLGSESKLYLLSASIISICKHHRVTMVHPGYGILSENGNFAHSAEAAGMIWLGPQPYIIRTMGLKHEARVFAANAGLKFVPESRGLVSTLDEALSIANTVGFPVILKATAGGGGMGHLVCRNDNDLSDHFMSAQERSTVSGVVYALPASKLNAYPSVSISPHNSLSQDSFLTRDDWFLLSDPVCRSRRSTAPILYPPFLRPRFRRLSLPSV